MTIAPLSVLLVDGTMRNGSSAAKPEGEFQRFFGLGKKKGINNNAGFRECLKTAAPGSHARSIADYAFMVLVTNFRQREWPDTLDRESGMFVYYGDNKEPGSAIGETARKGNRYLEEVFKLLHEGKRHKIPPFLLFDNSPINGKAAMRFLGLAAPGAEGLTMSDDLVGVWRIRDAKRFMNYKARLTVLDAPRVPRSWLAHLVDGVPPTEADGCPEAWKHWTATGFYRPLIAERTRSPRTTQEQLPQTAQEKEALRLIFEGLTDRQFEFAAAELIRLVDTRFIELEVTPPTRDGGRDVIGKYKLGHDLHQVLLSVYIEAKHYKQGQSIGVGDMSRLISRLKHRDLGVFITTSVFNKQVQQELLDDNHSVLLLSGGDVARLLINKKETSEGSLSNWIASVQRRTAEVDKTDRTAAQSALPLTA